MCQNQLSSTDLAVINDLFYVLNITIIFLEVFEFRVCFIDMQGLLFAVTYSFSDFFCASLHSVLKMGT